MAVRIVVLTLAAVMIQLPGVASPAGAAAASDAKIDAGLLALPDDKVVDFWVTFTAKAQLGPAAGTRDWKNRGQAVVDGLERTAKSSQAGVAAMLAARGIKFDSYWIANTGKVAGPKSLMRQLAARPEVAAVVADRTFDLPDPAPATDVAPATVEWNIGAVGAPAVWDGLGVRGEGIVVANLDTGVQFDHPALVNQYRGNLGGSFDHNYNWYDPSSVCGNPSVVPCDNNRHGTHTMGSMVGADATGQNQVGVAPGAKWIAVKGCEYDSCSTAALLGGGQWLLAPRDLNGQNPRPELRPNVVNNSWGGGGGNTFFQSIVTAWVAAGIFPAFANGNSGPGCGTAGSPADYPESYAVGAYNSAGAISSFSSRGSSTGVRKPDIAAPGESVRSSVPGNGYAVLSGTSMATPHVAGVVALMWSAAPSLVSDVARTRELLDETAIDVADLTCGGTNADNGVWGEGKLDALAAVLRSPRGPVGTLSGLISDRSTGAPIAGAQVRSVGADGFPRISRTSTTGTYSQTIPVGTIHVDVTIYGYGAATADVVIVENGTTAGDLSLVRAPSHAVSGVVVDDTGIPVQSASISIVGTPLEPAVTDATGRFGYAAVPDGTYEVAVTGGACLAGAGRSLVLDADATLDFALAARRDAFGYFCRPESPAYVEADTVLPLTGDDYVVPVALPFPFSYYGRVYSTAQVSTNGLVGLSGGSYAYTNGSIPSATLPNGTIYAFWDDMYVDGASSVRTSSIGTEPNRRFVIEWRNIQFLANSARLDFEVILDQRGGISMQYRRLFDLPLVRGSSATIGVENETGTIGLSYSYNQPSLLGTSTAMRFEVAGAAGNTAPDAVDDNAVTVANRNVAIPVLTNDRDPDGDRVDITAVSDPAHGYAEVRGDGTIAYVPDFGFAGTEVFTYDLADRRGGADRASVSVVVAPLATDDTAATAEDTPVNVHVLANDLNPQAGVLAVYGVSLPAHGTAVVVPGGDIRYTPYPDFNGSDTFAYSVVDGLGGSDQASVTIAVSAVEDPPRAVNDAGQVIQDSLTILSVLGNDSDPDGDTLQITAVSAPGHGTAVANPERTITYRPSAGYTGADSFTYSITDGHGGVSGATVSITVLVAPTTTTTTVPPTTTTTTVPPTTTTTTTRPAPVTARAPFSVWSQGAPAGLDGVGTWLVPLNDPTAAAGQVAPEYLYGLSFGFTASSARGVVGLGTGPGGKSAVLSVSGPGRAPQTYSIPFNWRANGVYFIFVHQYGPDMWGALVYDLSANAWTVVGFVGVPPAWGRIAPTTVTGLFSSGPPAATCAAYPTADFLVRNPTTFIAGRPLDETFMQSGSSEGTCTAVNVNRPDGWIWYGAGAR